MNVRRVGFACVALSLVVAVQPIVLVPAGAVVPGTNGRIVYAQNGTNFCPDILSVEPDGTGGGSLTGCPEGAEDPSWSPDASHVVFSTRTSEGGVGRIATMASDGSGLVLLTNSQDDDDPAWSPSGTEIAFGRGRTGPDSRDIWKMNADGTSPVNLTNAGAGGVNDEPDWSPDGTKIIFMGKNGPTYDIFIMNSDGTGMTNLTIAFNTADDMFPSWSPDGTKIVFSSDRDGNNEIYVMNADGSSPQRLTTNAFSDIQPTYSPDGTQIAFTRGCEDDQCSGPGGPADGEVIRMMNDGSAEAAVASGGGMQADPDWGVSCPECPPPDGGCEPNCEPPVDFRALTLALKGHLRAKGEITDGAGFTPCLAGQEIFIQKKGDKWRTVKTAVSKNDGTYSTELPDKPGKYRAKLKETEVGGETPARCTADKSAEKTHKH